jgi:para-nitrobenzyl esterase
MRPTSLRFTGALGAALALTATIATASPVRTEGGPVAGVAADGVVSWKGLPYAAPPVGDLRWREPRPAAPWKGVRVADAYAHDCM